MNSVKPVIKLVNWKNYLKLVIIPIEFEKSNPTVIKEVRILSIKR
jgi:hypothetical protein